MKIFVAGGTGVIGRRAVDQLTQAGHDVSVLTRSDAKAAEVHAQGATPVTASLFDRDALVAAVAGHDAVINLATHIPPLTKAARASAWAENDRIRTEGSRNLVDAALAAGASRYVQESIAFLYDDHGDGWIDETEPLIQSPFTTGVDHAEAEAARFGEAGGVAIVLRFGQFYAPEATHTLLMVRAARRGWAMLPGDDDAYAPLIQADDAAAAVVSSLDAPSGTYNVVDDEPMTRATWASTLAHAVGRTRLRRIPKLAQKMAARRAPNMVSSQRVSNAAFKRATGWTPRHASFRDGVFSVVGAADVVGSDR